MPLASVKGEDEDRVSVEPSAVAGISAFLGKLWKMVEDPKTDHLISWGKSGNTFVIKNQIDFAKTILPNYYKHNNIASFIRQLNMYGFHKIISTTSGALDSSDNDEIEFTHPSFVRGHPYLLDQIKRKMNNPKENFIKNENSNQFNESIKRVFSDIKNLKGKQEHLGSQLCAVKQENEILWRELSLLRQKHAAQQNVLNKLIRFLVSLAQPSTNHNLVKRRLVPLMLKDSISSSKSKISSYYEGDHMYTVKKREESSPSSPGPTIHEIHPSEVTDNMQIVETPVLEESSPIMIEHEIVTSPAPSAAGSDISINSPEPVPAALLLPSKKGKRGIQTMYVTPSQQLKPRFFISSGGSENDDSPEYLVPDKTDNPLLELVHETETDDNGEFITIVPGDEADIDETVPATLITDSELESVLSSKATNKKKATPRRRTKKETVSAHPLSKVSAVEKLDRKKKPTESKAVVDDVPNPNEFLFDIGLESCTEPIIGIQSSSDLTSDTSMQEPSEVFTLDTLAENRISKPITVEDMIDVAPAMTNSKISDTSVSNVPAATLPTLTLPAVNEAVHSPLQNTNLVFNVPDDSNAFIQPSNSPSSMNMNNRNGNTIKQINEYSDNTQNMKIACTDNSVPPTRSFVDEISIQVDNMQLDLDTIKENILQNEDFTLDSSTLAEIMNYSGYANFGIPQDITPNFHKLDEGKIEGNELISSQPTFLDFEDILGPNDWNPASTTLNTVDTDYSNLNTPQIEKSSDESQQTYPPPTKKIRIY